MPRRDPRLSPATYVDRGLGDTYEVVKLVAANLPLIQWVGDNIEMLKELKEKLEEEDGGV